MQKLAVSIVFLILSQHILADKISSAYKQIQKGDYDKAKKLLDKALEKDNTNAGAFHVYAAYYFSENNQAYSVDSSYFFVLKAIDSYPKADPKDSTSWAKDEISIETAKKLKKAIEEKAFYDAKKANSVKAFQHFIDYFDTAPQIPNAKSLRNTLAWEKATYENTRESYQAFIQSYPKAEQAKEAMKRRDKFIYDTLTADRKQSSYLDFLEKYKNSYYTNIAKNELFYLKTLEHSIESYHNFIRTYPSCDKARQAWEWLRVLFAEKNGLGNFLQQYPDYPQKTKLQDFAEVERLDLVPIYDNELYGFIDEQGQERITPKYEYIDKDYLCESITEDFLIVNINASLGLINKLGEEILKPQFDDIQPLSTGLFEVSKNGRRGLYLCNGSELLPLQYDNIEVLNAHFLKVKQNRRWGLASYNGKIIVEAKYSSIDTLSADFVAFRSNGLSEVKTNKELFRLAREGDVKVRLRFDKVEAVEQAVLVARGGKQGLIDQSSRLVFDTENIAIVQIDVRTFAVKKEDFWKVYDLSTRPISGKVFQSIAYSKYLVAGKLDGKWGVIDLKGKEVLPFESDSVALVESVILSFKGKKIEGIFQANTEKVSKDFSFFKNIRAEKGNYPEAQTFLYYEDRYKHKGLFAQSGKKILSPKYNSLYVLDSQLVSVSVNGRYGLVDTLQKLVLPIRYAGINNMGEGFKTTLLNGKFGIYHYDRKLNIQPIYDIIPKIFSKQDSNYTFLVKKRGKFGIINEKNQAIVPFKFLDIKPYQSNTVLVQVAENEWIFFDFSSEASKAETPTFTEAKILVENTQDIFVEVRKEGKRGLWYNKKGEVLKPEANLIQNIGTVENPVFFVEKRLDNAQYEVKYINSRGKTIWRKILDEVDYFKIVCE